MKTKLDQEKYREIADDIRKLDGGEHGLFYDGAFDLELYSTTTPRILWILKEAVGDYGADRYDTKLVNDNIESINSVCSTLEIVSYVSYGILRNKALWNDIPYIRDDGGAVLQTLREIAIINVKKAMGERTARNSRLIIRAYQENKALLRKQIDFYNPDIIIFGFPDACSEIVNDVIAYDDPAPTRRNIGPCAYFITPRRRFVWHYHPSSPRGNGQKQKYVEEVLKAATSD